MFLEEMNLKITFHPPSISLISQNRFTHVSTSREVTQFHATINTSGEVTPLNLHSADEVLGLKAVDSHGNPEQRPKITFVLLMPPPGDVLTQIVYNRKYDPAIALIGYASHPACVFVCLLACVGD